MKSQIRICNSACAVYTAVQANHDIKLPWLEDQNGCVGMHNYLIGLNLINTRHRYRPIGTTLEQVTLLALDTQYVCSTSP